MDYSNQIWEKVKEGVDYLCNMIVDGFDKCMSFATSKFKELAGSVGSSAAEGMRGAKNTLSNAISPNAIGKAKSDPSPSTEVGPAMAPEKSPVQQSQNFGKILESSGFSRETLGNLDIGADDLGQASVGLEGVGCASHTAPRATQSYALVR